MFRVVAKTLLLVAIFALSLVLARVLSGKWVSAPHFLYELGRLVGVEVAPSATETGRPDTPITVRQLLAESHARIDCALPERAPVTRKNETRVFRWRDENGRWQFSDTAPAQTAAEEIELPSTGKNYFSLQVRYPAGIIPADIKRELEISGKSVYKVYSAYLEPDLLARADIDIHVYGDGEAYRRLRQQVAPELAANTPGFYSPGQNRAVVLHEGSREQTRRTAIHEATHAVNAVLFGRTPNWYNEGLAEYFENIRASGQLVEILPDRHWLASAELQQGPMALAPLLAADPARWSGPERSRYYANAWALVFYLMSPDNKAYMRAYLAELGSNRCAPVDSVGFFSRHYPGGLAALERDWQAWLKSGSIKAHRL